MFPWNSAMKTTKRESSILKKPWSKSSRLDGTEIFKLSEKNVKEIEATEMDRMNLIVKISTT